MQNDLLEVCRGLQSQGVRYILVGGHALRINGILRATEDVDILVPFDRDNGLRLVRGLSFLESARDIDPDWFTREANTPDVENIRIADRMLIDILFAVNGETYETLQPHVRVIELEGVSIPVLDAQGLLKAKTDCQVKDLLDKAALKRLTEEGKGNEFMKRIVCLANSRKLNGRCIAGIELSQEGGAKGWIRPVSAREHEEVSEYERQYQDGSDPRVLDIVDVPLLEHRPKAYQQENWLLDPQHYWVRVGQLTWTELTPLTTELRTLWINGYHTYHGMHDSIPLELAASVGSSLCLVKASSLRISVFAPGEAFGNPKRRVQGQFKYQGVEYRLWVTDPGVERTFLRQPDGDHVLGECYLTISLGEPYKGACNKLIAAIIQKP